MPPSPSVNLSLISQATFSLPISDFYVYIKILFVFGSLYTPFPTTLKLKQIKGLSSIPGVVGHVYTMKTDVYS